MSATTEKDSSDSLGRSALTILVGIVVGSALALVAEMYLARSLAPEVYGTVALAYTLIYALGLLLGNGIGDAIARTLNDRSGDAPGAVVSSGLVIALTIGGLLMTVGYAIRRPLAESFGEPALATYLLWLLPFGLIYPLGQVAFGTIRADTGSKIAVLVKDFAPRLLGIGVLVVAAALGASLLGAIAYWLMFPSGILLFGFGYLLFRQRNRTEPLVAYPDGDTLRTVWGHAWPLAASASMFMLLSTLDVLMIGVFATSSEVGLYRAIQPLRQSTTFVLSAFSFAFLPLATRRFSNGQLDSLGQLFTTSAKWIVTATLPLVLVFICYTESVVELLLGAAYAPAAPALAVLTAGLFFRALTGLDGDLVKAIDRPRVELWTAAVGVGVNVVLNLWAIPRFGIVGAAIGTAVGYAVYNALELAVIYRAVGIHPFSKATTSIVFLTVVVALLVRLVTGGGVGVVALVAAGGVIGLSAVGSLLLVGDLSDAEIQAFRQLERRTGVRLLWLVPKQNLGGTNT
jgi:O-antigen/teichoic acid export membrane protein